MMKNLLKLTIEILIMISGLGGLVKLQLINPDIAITIGIIVFVFLLCFQELKGSIDILINPLAEIQKFLGEKFKFIPLHPVQPKGITESYSPIRLTQFGQKLLEASKVKKVIDEQYPNLEKRIDEKHCKTALDVQEYIQRFIPELENENFMNPIKSFVYNNPKFDNIELELENVQRTMVIYLRDKYLAKHPEIAQ